MCPKTRISQNNHLSIEDWNVSVKQNFEKMGGESDAKSTIAISIDTRAGPVV